MLLAQFGWPRLKLVFIRAHYASVRQTLPSLRDLQHACDVQSRHRHAETQRAAKCAELRWPLFAPLQWFIAKVRIMPIHFNNITCVHRCQSHPAVVSSLKASLACCLWSFLLPRPASFASAIARRYPVALPAFVISNVKHVECRVQGSARSGNGRRASRAEVEAV